MLITVAPEDAVTVASGGMFFSSAEASATLFNRHHLNCGMVSISNLRPFQLWSPYADVLAVTNEILIDHDASRDADACLRPLDACPVCDGKCFVPYLTTTDCHFGIAGEWDLSRCQQCDLIFLDPMPTPEFVGTLYPDDYYSFTFDESAKPSFASRVRCQLMPFRSGDPIFSKEGRMVDVGCGNGWTLKAYQDQGWEVAGVEYSDVGAAAGRSRGLDVRTGSLMDAEFPDAHFGYVRMNHSFEHMTNPGDVLREVSRIMQPDALGFIAVPNVSSLLSRVFKKYWYSLGAPVHVFSYSTVTLPALLHRHGFEVVSTRTNSDQASAILSLQIWLNRNSARRADEGVFNGLLKPLYIPAYWFSKLLDRFGVGDAVEVVYRKRNVAV